MLTLKQMKEIIARGESVMYKGTVISNENPEDLPTEAELALESGSTTVIADTKKTLEAELTRLQQQLKLVSENSTAVASEDANDAEGKKGRKVSV